MIPAFEADYKLVLFDYVGAGGSDFSAFDRTHYSSLRGYAADVLEIIDELELGSVTFVGHSVEFDDWSLGGDRETELF